MSAPPNDPSTSHAPGPTRALGERLSVWIGLIIAVAAFILSIFTYVQSQRTPEITMNLPSIMRIRGGDMFDIYLQPSFSVPSEYDRTAEIASVQLEFSRAGAPPSERADFYWESSGQFMMVNGSADFSYAADPGPFIVGEDEPQRPTILFRSDAQRIAPGRWTGTLTALRDQGQNPLVKRFCVVVTDMNMAEYSPVGNYQHINFRNDRPGSSTDCYWRPD